MEYSTIEEEKENQKEIMDEFVRVTYKRRNLSMTRE